MHIMKAYFQAEVLRCMSMEGKNGKEATVAAQRFTEQHFQDFFFEMNVSHFVAVGGVLKRFKLSVML